jgi:putative transposase
MARPLRIEYPGAFYHITSRGNARQDIFKTKKDFKDFLIILKENTERYNWQCYAYCLMSNHYHLLIKTLDPNLSQGMRQLNGVYTQKSNYNHKTVGHIFQGRYKAILVDEEKYFYELVRYIVLNPVRAKMVKNPENYHWSSHREIIGVRSCFLHSADN